MSEEQWDFAKAEMRPAVKAVRSIVSVAFSSEELAAVAAKARAEGKAVSRYIHDEAMRRVATPTLHLLVDGEEVTVSMTR